MTQSISLNADVADQDVDMMVRNELHTKYATPRRLSQALKDIFGGSAQFQVEMRHNVYNIKSSKPLDVEVLFNKCQGRYRR